MADGRAVTGYRWFEIKAPYRNEKAREVIAGFSVKAFRGVLVLRILIDLDPEFKTSFWRFDFDLDRFRHSSAPVTFT